MEQPQDNPLHQCGPAGVDPVGNPGPGSGPGTPEDPHVGWELIEVTAPDETKRPGLLAVCSVCKSDVWSLFRYVDEMDSYMKCAKCGMTYNAFPDAPATS